MRKRIRWHIALGLGNLCDRVSAGTLKESARPPFVSAYFAALSLFLTATWQLTMDDRHPFIVAEQPASLLLFAVEYSGIDFAGFHH